MSSVVRSAALWLAFWVAIPALAVAHENPGSVAPTFESLDRNADNRLSRTEAGYNRLLSEIFVTSDVNGDGFVSRAEYERTVSKEEIVTRFNSASASGDCAPGAP